MAPKLVLILADGHWPKAGPSKSVLDEANFIIAANGGWAKARAYQITVDLVVGDLDSLSPEEADALASSGIQTHVFSQAKDRTDLEIALDYALLLGPTRVVVVGGLGGRLDHTLANTLLLEKAARTGVAIEIESEEERVFVVNDRLCLKQVAEGDLISLLPLSEVVEGVQTKGLRFSLEHESLARASSRGVSNEITSVPAEIQIERGLLLVVHQVRHHSRTHSGTKVGSKG